MTRLQKLLAKRAELLAEAEAINNLADKESRELSAEDTKRLNAILGAGDVEGEIKALDALIERERKLEALKNDALSNAANSGRLQTGSGNTTGTRIEALDRQRHGKLHGFSNREDAFQAGAWCAAQLLGNQRAAEYCNQLGLRISNAMSGGDNGAGGYLVPEVLENSIVRLVEEYGVFRANASVMPMASDTVNIPRNTGDVTAYFVNEVPSSITASDLAFDLATLTAKVLAVRTLISNDLMESAIIDLGNLVAVSAALKFSEKEDDCGFNGTGASTYGGIVGLSSALAAGSKKTAAAGNTAFSTLDLADFEGMVGLLPSYARTGAKWYISQAGWADSMLRLQNAAGGNTMMDLGNGPRLSFLGYEVVIAQKCNSTLTAQTSTTGLAFLGRLDLAATVGVRRGIRVAVLRELYAGTRQTGLIIDQRIDINVHERGTASAAGPMIALATPGS